MPCLECNHELFDYYLDDSDEPEECECSCHDYPKFQEVMILGESVDNISSLDLRLDDPELWNSNTK